MLPWLHSVGTTPTHRPKSIESDSFPNSHQSRPDLLTINHERFGLLADRTEAKRDSHYISTRRLDGCTFN